MCFLARAPTHSPLTPHGHGSRASLSRARKRNALLALRPAARGDRQLEAKEVELDLLVGQHRRVRPAVDEREAL